MYTICYLKTGDQIADLMCVFKTHESFAYFYALITNVAVCTKTLEDGHIVYKWRVTPKDRYIK